jgi:hypothetical protein
MLVFKKWSLNFPLSEARFFPSGVLDHSPMIVKVIGYDQHQETIQILQYMDGS